MVSRLCLERAPVSDDVGAIAVDLEPGDGFGQHRAMQQRALGARRRLGFEQSRLQGENLLETFDVPSRDWKHSQLDAAFERIG